MLDVVGEVCGIHAQVASCSEISLGVRVDGITRRDIRAALWDSRTLVKTYGLRRTLHLFPTRELPLWRAALRTRTPAQPSNPQESVAVPPDRRVQLIGAILDALDCRVLTHSELGGEVERRLGGWTVEEVFPAFTEHWPRWQIALIMAAEEGLVVFGPNRGNLVTYARTEDWIGPQPACDGPTAVREVCRRFLGAYGPATPLEFARWFATTPRAAREVMQSLELDEVDVDGWRAWLPRGDAEPGNSGDGGGDAQPGDSGGDGGGDARPRNSGGEGAASSRT